jgi:PAS domain S-box-containing protein
MSSTSFDDVALRLATVAPSDGAVFTQDLTGSITSWNRGAEQLFGSSVAEAVGQPMECVAPKANP